MADHCKYPELGTSQCRLVTLLVPLTFRSDFSDRRLASVAMLHCRTALLQTELQLSFSFSVFVLFIDIITPNSFVLYLKLPCKLNLMSFPFAVFYIYLKGHEQLAIQGTSK